LSEVFEADFDERFEDGRLTEDRFRFNFVPSSASRAS